jgi:hypothetical protein
VVVAVLGVVVDAGVVLAVVVVDGLLETLPALPETLLGALLGTLLETLF